MADDRCSEFRENISNLQGVYTLLEVLFTQAAVLKKQVTGRSALLSSPALTAHYIMSAQRQEMARRSAQWAHAAGWRLG